MKIELFTNTNFDKLQNDVNDFISNADIHVIDIKMSSYDNGTDIIVIYDENKGAE